MHGPAIWWPCSASAGWAISAFSLRLRGLRTVAIARGKTKSRWPANWAPRYIDNQSHDPAAELQNLGGAKVILATVTNGDAMEAVMGGLGREGALMIIGAAPSLKFLLSDAPRMPVGERLVFGNIHRFAGHARFQRALRRPFDERTLSVRSRDEAYERMLSGKARFRVVLTTGG